jgi:hypothetical protein
MESSKTLKRQKTENRIRDKKYSRSKVQKNNTELQGQTFVRWLGEAVGGSGDESGKKVLCRNADLSFFAVFGFSP